VAPFKDFVKKARDLAEKGLSTVKEAMALEALLRDFDERVANTIAAILVDRGYRVIGQREAGDYYELVVAVDDYERVKPIIERDMMKRYSPRDREKILDVKPDTIVFKVHYDRELKSPKTLLPSSAPDDVRVSATLYYYVERKGFLSVKRERREVPLGTFSFRSSDYVDAERHVVDGERLRSYLEQKLRIFGIV